MILTNTSKKIITLTILNGLMVWYIIFMFIKSEPTYINNKYGKPVVGDYLTVYFGEYDGWGQGLVVQTDSIAGFVVNVKTSLMSTASSGLMSIPYSGTNYRIVGTGTFYHRVNSYVGFNIMFITILIITVFFTVVFITEVSIIKSLIFDED